ncbi:MAG: trypsin-like peptidase domain-containing protein, partial [Oscillospiraceae bacterium]|nr:trypsin-like peptidase domain-containing protein [Oscillospiraceae bacterium]
VGGSGQGSGSLHRPAPPQSGPPFAYGSSAPWYGNAHDPSSDPMVNAVSRAYHSVVAISVTRAGAFGTQSRGSGSGVIIAHSLGENGQPTGTYIITNEHVIADATENGVTVTLTSGATYPAVIVGMDAETDVGVVWVNVVGLHLAELGTSADLMLGQTVIAIGNALGQLSGTVTSGIISATARDIDVEGRPMRLLQMDAAVNPGNSGGGLFDLNGRLVGVVNAKSMGNNVEGLGFSIPIDVARIIAEELILYGRVVGRPRIGISVVTVTQENQNLIDSDNPELRPFFYINNQLFPGVYIIDHENVVYSNRSNGTFLFGDRIVRMNNTNIREFRDIRYFLLGMSAGDEVNVTVARPGGSGYVTHRITIVLSELNEQ